MKKKRTLVIALVLALLVVAVVSTVIVFAQKNTEQNLEQTKPSTENAYESQTYTDETLYFEHLKEISINGDDSQEKIGLKVCKKYNLDPKTVRICDMTSEMFDYEYALYLLENQKEFSLLAEKGREDVMDSLEVGINDIFAFGGARQIIIEVCDKNNIDVDKSVIGDLNEEILMEIQRIAYEKSPHKGL